MLLLDVVEPAPALEDDAPVPVPAPDEAALELVVLEAVLVALLVPRAPPDPVEPPVPPVGELSPLSQATLPIDRAAASPKVAHKRT